MGTGSLFPSQLGMNGLLKGQLEQSQDGRVLLRTKQGIFPVRVEGEGVPFGKEVVFRLLREEPGLVVLSPYRLETLGEALPFFKELFAGEEILGRQLLLAAVQENLPLTREVLFNLKRGLLTAEQAWGVKVHPRAVAFLQARALPLSPRTLLWALYVLFPAAQKAMWQLTSAQPPILPFLPKKQNGQGTTTEAGAKDQAVTTKEELLETIFREARAILQQQAHRDPGLPHLLFYYFPTPQTEIRWIGRSFTSSDHTGEEDDKEGRGQNHPPYAFCLAYQSPVFGQLEIIGVCNQSGLNLKVMVAGTVLRQNCLAGLQTYLEERGWPVRTVEFEEYQAAEVTDVPPLRIDGWL
ncbi:MAG: hypothetical protein GX073_04800 [Firmicutes bacterium]|nr:hypothetical protein [Bacillota bacterium]